MNASNLSFNQTSLEMDQAVCHSTDTKIRELKDCVDMDKREELAQSIVANAITRSLEQGCMVRVRKSGSGFVLTVVHPNSQLSEMLPPEATDWIRQSTKNQEIEPLYFSLAVPHSILVKSRLESAN